MGETASGGPSWRARRVHIIERRSRNASMPCSTTWSKSMCETRSLLFPEPLVRSGRISAERPDQRHQQDADRRRQPDVAVIDVAGPGCKTRSGCRPGKRVHRGLPLLGCAPQAPSIANARRSETVRSEEAAPIDSAVAYLIHGFYVFTRSFIGELYHFSTSL